MVGLSSVFLVASALSGDLTTAAQLSSRPSACAPSSSSAGASAPGAWDQIREQGRLELCRRFARIQLELGGNPAQALSSAQQLGRELPERPEPWLYAARAQARVSTPAEAWPLWEQALKHGEELRSAHALHDYARSAALSGHAEQALGSYRKLLPLLQAWHDPIDQQVIYLEAAAAAWQRGPAGLDEAAGHLASARARATSTELRAYVAGLGALLALRRGAALPPERRLDAPEIWHFVGAVQSQRWPRRWPVLPAYEVFGAAALLVEPYSDTVSSELWQQHLQGLEQAGAAEAWRAVAARGLPKSAPPARARRSP